jgi:hypothetical protein
VSLRGAKPRTSRRLQGEDGDLGGAVQAEWEAYGADAAVDVELEAVEAVEAFDVLLAPGWEDDGAEEWEADLASVGVAGEHDVDDVAAGMVDDLVGVVGRVAHQQDGAVGAGGEGEVKVGLVGCGVGDAGEPEALAAALDGEVLVVEDGDLGVAEGVADDGQADRGVVVAHDAEALGAGEVFEDGGAAVGGGLREGEGERAVADEVAGEEEQVGGERVDVRDDAREEGGVGVLVEVDVGELDDAVVVEGFGEVGDGDGAGEDADLVAGDLAGVEGHAGSDG